MIINPTQIRDSYDFIIVGAGVSGLAMARFLANSNKSILIIESGELGFSKNSNKKSYAKSQNLGNWPTENYASHHSRVRMFGGNANVWGGWCMELDEYDYINNKYWNLLKKDLKNHYKNAYKLLNINPKVIDSKELGLKKVEPYVINISRGNYINECKNFLVNDKNTEIILNAELQKIYYQDNAATSIDVIINDIISKDIKLKKLILSTGGIECVKILKNNIQFENQNKNLGKYFMEHPQLQVGRVTIRDKKINNFISKYSPPTAKHLFDDRLNIRADKYFSGFKTSNKNVRNYFVLRTTDVYQSKTLYRLRHILLTKSLSSVGKIKFKDIIELISDILNLIFKKIRSKLITSKSYSVVLHLEQNSNMINSVYLDDSGDTILNWNFTDEDLANLHNSIDDLNEIFTEMKAQFNLKNELKLEGEQIQEFLRQNIFGIGHHMGTTRMGFSNIDSICDLNLKIHEYENIYINSSSVFPSGGIANPTLTLLALTSRLAETLKNE